MKSTVKRALKKIIIKNRYKCAEIKETDNIDLKSKFGTGTTIYKGCTVFVSDIGDYTYVAEKAVICNATIGKFCSIGPAVRIGLGRHPASKFVSTHPAFFSTRKQAGISFVEEDVYEESLPIFIGNDVWIGANAMIMDGISIADGAIVAAGAVVTKDVLPYTIVGGMPAKLISKRFNEQQINHLLNIKWWEKDIEWIKENSQLMQDIDKFVYKNQREL